jgi:hypothetical protein
MSYNILSQRKNSAVTEEHYKNAWTELTRDKLHSRIERCGEDSNFLVES